MLKLLAKAKRYTLPMVFVTVFLFAIAMCDLLLPRLMANLVNDGINKGDNGLIMRVGVQMLGVSAFSVVLQIVVNYLSALSSMGFGRDLRSEVFRKITYLSLQQSDEFGAASLVTRTSSDVREMQMLMQMGLGAVVSVPLHMIGGVIMALSMDAPLATVIIVSMPLLLLIVYININWVRPLFERMRDKLDSVSRVLREILSGVRVIRAFNTIGMERDRFNQTNLDYTSAFKQARRRMALVNPFTTAVTSFAIIGVYWFGQFRIESGAMSAGDIMAFSQYVMQILGSVMGLQMMFNMIPSAITASKRLVQILDVTPAIVDPQQPQTPKAAQLTQQPPGGVHGEREVSGVGSVHGEREVGDVSSVGKVSGVGSVHSEGGVRGEVRFENVTFQYPGAEKPVLENISFTARPGETTAIIGGTGSGKSTLASLIPRLYDIQGGRIFVDRTDITQMAQRDLRNRIGFIPQKAQLFTGSVENNIRFGKTGASEAEVIAAAEIAQAADFIAAMEGGYDSFISQDATNLSGGQKQRISIARAIARNPEVYIFDDSFSAVDYKTDAALRSALKAVTRESAVIIVAQRVSTIMDADNILVLDEGKCVGQGTHASLMQDCGVYREIVRSQLKEEDIA